jgi:hypothetical protein
MWSTRLPTRCDRVSGPRTCLDVADPWAHGTLTHEDRADPAQLEMPRGILGPAHPVMVPMGSTQMGFDRPAGPGPGPSLGPAPHRSKNPTHGSFCSATIFALLHARSVLPTT